MPFTDEQLANIGERATGFTMTRTIYVHHTRGTRRSQWTHSEVSFVRCRVVVRVGAGLGPDHVLGIARELDRWMASRDR